MVQEHELGSHLFYHISFTSVSRSRACFYDEDSVLRNIWKENFLMLSPEMLLML